MEATFLKYIVGIFLDFNYFGTK